MLKTRFQRGFTLVETLVAILILAILLKIAVPSFTSLVALSRVTAASRDFLGTLSYARAEAIRRNAPVSVCASDASFSACGTTAGWKQYGWIVFLDPNNTGVATAANLMQRYPALPTDISLSAAQTRVTYSSGGYVLNGVGVYTFNTPNCSGQNGRQIQVGLGGRPSVSYIACA